MRAGCGLAERNAKRGIVRTSCMLRGAAHAPSRLCRTEARPGRRSDHLALCLPSCAQPLGVVSAITQAEAARRGCYRGICARLAGRERAFIRWRVAWAAVRMVRLPATRASAPAQRTCTEPSLLANHAQPAIAVV